MIVSLRHLLGYVSAFGSRENLVLENLALRQHVLALHAKRPRRRDSPTQAVLGRVKYVLVWVDEAFVLCHSQNRREPSSGWVSFVLGMGLKSETTRNVSAQQRSSRPDLPYDCQNPNWGAPGIDGELLRSWVLIFRKRASRDGLARPELIRVWRLRWYRYCDVLKKGERQAPAINLRRRLPGGRNIIEACDAAYRSIRERAIRSNQ